jgi:hypothetical protein
MPGAISNPLRQAVIHRAAATCEYCRLPQFLKQTFEVMDQRNSASCVYRYPFIRFCLNYVIDESSISHYHSSDRATPIPLSRPITMASAHQPSETDRLDVAEIWQSLPEYAGTPRLREKGEASFYRDLSAILAERGPTWVAYYGDEQIGFGKSKSELFERCLKQGLSADEFIVLFADEAARHDHDPIELTPQ